MAGTATVRVRAVGLVFGYREGEGHWRATTLVPPGTGGDLLTIGVDGYVVRWDDALRINGPDDATMGRLGPTTVHTDLGQTDRIVPGPIEVSAVEAGEDAEDEDIDEETVIRLADEEDEDEDDAIVELAEQVGDLAEEVEALANAVKGLAEAASNRKGD